MSDAEEEGATLHVASRWSDGEEGAGAARNESIASALATFGMRPPEEAGPRTSVAPLLSAHSTTTS